MAKVTVCKCDVCGSTDRVFTVSGKITHEGKDVLGDRDVCHPCFVATLDEAAPKPVIYRGGAGNPGDGEMDDGDHLHPYQRSGYRGPTGPLPPPECPDGVGRGIRVVTKLSNG